MKQIKLLYQVKDKSNGGWNCKDVIIFLPLETDPSEEIKLAESIAEQKLEKEYVEFKKI